jgi:signal transduction histidine kinase
MCRPVTTSMERPMTHQANGRISGDNDLPVPTFGTTHPVGADDEWIREDERKRIARDIHDELGQQILVLRMDILRLRDRIAETHPQLQAFVGDVLQQLDATMQSVRAVIRGLRPAVLDLGLRAAAEWQCVEFNRRSRIACDLAWNAGDILMPDRCGTALFRTLQESLTNVHRHAQASRVWITVHIESKNIVMAVSDNGIGWAPADRAQLDSFGLSCMRERIAALGGKLTIGDGVHEGMTLTVSLPV